MRTVPGLIQRQLRSSIAGNLSRSYGLVGISYKRRFTTSQLLRGEGNGNDAAATAAEAEAEAALAREASATEAALESLRSSIQTHRHEKMTATRAAKTNKLQLSQEGYEDVFSTLSDLYKESKEKYDDVDKAHHKLKGTLGAMAGYDIGPNPREGIKVSDLTDRHIGESVTVYGFIKTVRLHNKLLAFADLNDDGKVLQLIHCTSKYPGIYDSLKSLSFGASVRAKGVLKKKKLPERSAEGVLFFHEMVELQLEEFEVYNNPSVYIMPDTVFQPHQRHLQIRTDPKLLAGLKLRARVASICRNVLESRGFLEVETPLLFKSTPEGAREFLVVTREKGHMYALPQSPQQYKQILMASGIPKYYQIAKCFRDEDLRADRQPEFTQLDMEMSFADGESVMHETEQLIRQIMWNTIGLMVPKIERIKYHDAIAKYGSDKPDLRYDLEIKNVTPLVHPGCKDYIYEMIVVRNVELSRAQFQRLFDATFGGDIIPTPHTTDPRKPDLLLTGPGRPLNDSTFTLLIPELKEAQESARKEVTGKINARKEQASLLPYHIARRRKPVTANSFEEMVIQWSQRSAKDLLVRLCEKMHIGNKDIVAIGKRKDVFSPGGGTRMGELRKRLHAALVEGGYVPAPQGYKFAWITDFPLFTPDEDTVAAAAAVPSSPSVSSPSPASIPPPVDTEATSTSTTTLPTDTTTTTTTTPSDSTTAPLLSTHHPFTSPLSSHLDLLYTDPTKVLAHHYDITLNGVEIGGGSTRIHSPSLQKYILSSVLNLPPHKLSTFDHLIEVLESGCPPHAGIALGFDRLVSLIHGVESIRDVIAFPKNNRGVDPVVDSPGVVREDVLEGYGLRFTED